MVLGAELLFWEMGGGIGGAEAKEMWELAGEEEGEERGGGWEKGSV